MLLVGCGNLAPTVVDCACLLFARLPVCLFACLLVFLLVCLLVVGTEFRRSLPCTLIITLQVEGHVRRAGCQRGGSGGDG
jgi:hypothetical protein